MGKIDKDGYCTCWVVVVAVVDVMDLVMVVVSAVDLIVAV